MWSCYARNVSHTIESISLAYFPLSRTIKDNHHKYRQNIFLSTFPASVSVKGANLIILSGANSIILAFRQARRSATPLPCIKFGFYPQEALVFQGFLAMKEKKDLEKFIP